MRYIKIDGFSPAILPDVSFWGTTLVPDVAMPQVHVKAKIFINVGPTFDKNYKQPFLTFIEVQE